MLYQKDRLGFSQGHATFSEDYPLKNNFLKKNPEIVDFFALGADQAQRAYAELLPCFYTGPNKKPFFCLLFSFDANQVSLFEHILVSEDEKVKQSCLQVLQVNDQDVEHFAGVILFQCLLKMAFDDGRYQHFSTPEYQEAVWAYMTIYLPTLSTEEQLTFLQKALTPSDSLGRLFSQNQTVLNKIKTYQTTLNVPGSSTTSVGIFTHTKKEDADSADLENAITSTIGNDDL